MEEHTLIQGLLRQDRKAQEELYRMYYKPFLGLAYRKYGYIDRYLLEECLQDGFYRIFLNIDKYSGVGSLFNWSFTVFSNVLKHKFKSKSYKYIPIIPDAVFNDPIEERIDLNMVVDLSVRSLNSRDITLLYSNFKRDRNKTNGSYKDLINLCAQGFSPKEVHEKFNLISYTNIEKIHSQFKKQLKSHFKQ